MMRLRALGFPGEMCCLPSPYRIPRRVAGMAFNFSRVEIAPRAVVEVASELTRQQDGARGRADAAAFLFGIGRYAPAT